MQMSRPIRILHVFRDDKFFDVTSGVFDALEGVENLYYFHAPDPAHKFRFIRRTDRVKVFNSKEDYVRNFSDPDIDIIYFQSMHHSVFHLFQHIDPAKKVIWWCWGYEIYSPSRLLPPLLPIKCYGALTAKQVRKKLWSKYNLLRYPYWILRYFHDIRLRKKVISRVDYFSPVLPIEYDLLRAACPYFRAKPFMMRGAGWAESPYCPPHKTAGNVLIGNSLTHPNNHLEIFEIIRPFRLKGQQYILPVSYGGEYGFTEIKRLANLPEGSTRWLEGFMPREEYDALFAGITHAIFGHLRQQALGNIYICLSRGVKIFFFKESLIYKSLTADGYAVFTIEDDLSENALQTPLSDAEAEKNYAILKSQFANVKERTENELRKIMGRNTR